MADGVNLIVIKGSQGYDVTDLVQQVKWSGRKGSSSRYIEVSMLDDEDRADRANIDVEKGHQCIFSYNGAELFRGIIMRLQQTGRKQLTFKAYDNGIYLANNKDTFNYSNKTLSEIFKDVCSRFGMPYSECTDTNYRIPELTKPKTTAFDALCDAMSQTYAASGQRYYIDSQKGSLRLLRRRENVMQWVIEPNSNLISYTNSISIEKVRTRVKLLSDEGTVLAEKSNPTLEKAIGVMQDIDNPDETLNSAQLQTLVSSMLAEKSAPERSLKVDALGIPEVIAGLGVFVVIPSLNISKTYYVDEDTHIFKDNYHKMSLTLNLANDSEYDKSKNSTAQQSGGSYKVGDVVNFNGGNHYISSVSSSPVGGTRKGGKAKITYTAPGAKHPYHLVGGAYNNLGGSCNVYGWVDSGSFS